VQAAVDEHAGRIGGEEQEQRQQERQAEPGRHRDEV
jgi:hypothetical protein